MSDNVVLFWCLVLSVFVVGLCISFYVHLKKSHKKINSRLDNIEFIIKNEVKQVLDYQKKTDKVLDAVWNYLNPEPPKKQ